MSRSNTRNFFAKLFVFVATLTLVWAELGVAAQNSNSSTTTQNDNMSQGNMNMGGTTRRSRGRRRRGRRRGSSMTNANSACGPMQENTNMAGSMQENANTAGAMTGNTRTGGRRRGRRRVIDATNSGTQVVTGPGQEIITERPVNMPGRCDPNTQTQEDLSGTYTGTVNYSEGGLSGDATLTISGNDFTLTSGSSTQEGRIMAVNTCKYIGATMMFGKWQAAAPGATPPAPLTTISLTAKRTGGGLSLMSAPGERREFSFTSKGGGTGSGKGRRRPRQRKVEIKPPTVR